MRRSIFLVGSAMLVIGFIFYQFGFSAELHQATLLGRWLNEIAGPVASWGLSLDDVAVILQFIGGLLVVFGLVVCFAGVARSDKIQFQSRSIEPERTEPKGAVKNCKFCGAEIKEGSTFCSSCNKSQT
jgi:hypothetical protein